MSHLRMLDESPAQPVLAHDDPLTHDDPLAHDDEVGLRAVRGVVVGSVLSIALWAVGVLAVLYLFNACLI